MACLTSVFNLGLLVQGNVVAARKELQASLMDGLVCNKLWSNLERIINVDDIRRGDIGEKEKRVFEEVQNDNVR